MIVAAAKAGPRQLLEPFISFQVHGVRKVAASSSDQAMKWV
jgi:hypothetical protein